MSVSNQNDCIYGINLKIDIHTKCLHFVDSALVHMI